MKIAIFADSHGDAKILRHYPNCEKFYINVVGLAWTELLSQEFDVTNFSMSGTGVYYSYKLFCENHAKFDKIIFIPSQSGRFTISLPDTKTDFHCVPSFIDSIEDLISSSPPHQFQNKQTYSAARDYIIHILDLKKEQVFNDLMIEDIKKTRPDTIIIPAFQSPRTGSSPVLSYISILELEHWNVTVQYLRSLNLTEVRKCHLSIENNHMVFEKVKDVLNGVSPTVDISKYSFRVPTHPWQNYFMNLGLPRNI